MRIVLAANPGLGHVLPLLPLAIAARDAGHHVRFLGGASLAPAVERHGFALHQAGPADIPAIFRQLPEAAGLSGKRHAAIVWSRGFGGIVAPQLVRALLGLADTFMPDLVVHDDSEQGTWIAAEKLGVPHLALQATAWRSAGVRLAAGPLGELRASLGLPDDPDLARWHRNGFLVTRPPSLLDPADPPPETAMPLRPVAHDDDGAPVPARLVTTQSRERPRVAVTFGTILPGRVETIAGVLDGLATLDAEVVVAAGPGVDPSSLEAAYPNVTVEGYVPMSQLLPTCDAIVFHGGSGTLLAAMGAGVPVLMLPVAADQPENAARVVAAGAGLALTPDTRHPAAVRAAVEQLLHEPACRAAARRIAAEIAAMPSPAAVVPSLERLADAGPGGRLAPASG